MTTLAVDGQMQNTADAEVLIVNNELTKITLSNTKDSRSQLEKENNAHQNP